MNSTASERGCALVTGGGRGIGAQIALTLAAAGWPVAVGYRSDRQKAKDVVTAIQASGKVAVAAPGDLSDPDAIEGVFVALEEKFGRVAVLVNNAGIRADGISTGLTDDDWESVMATNVSAAFRTSRRALPSMIRARHGRIINVSSFVAERAIAGIANYAASKAALSGLTRAMASEVARRGVTVNAVAPGLVATDLTQDLSHFSKSVERGVPMQRPADLTEIADGVRFLASDAASYITGHTLAIDGGLSAMAFSVN